MNAAWIIQKKRDGETLSSEEISFLVCGFTRGEIPDYQMAAFAMAVFFRGMDARETADLTLDLIASGRKIEWPSVGESIVDKHSTGGQGDKVSLALAPVVACSGMRVPMVAGRGLGPTGGTIDKLESIPGFRTTLAIDEIRRQCEKVGCSISTQSEEFVPADRKLYALRDVTATVASIPLITASILSKKIAEGLDALVLDIKWGSGAFMKTRKIALELATTMVAVGEQLGVRTRAILTDMSQPLGHTVGNALEVEEAIDVLKGDGPEDLTKLVVHLSTELSILAGSDVDAGEAERAVWGAIDSGRAYDIFREMVIAQGGDPDAKLEIAQKKPVLASRTGYVRAIDGEKLGYAVIALGGGRRALDDKLDHSVGLTMRVRIGDRVESAQPVVDIHANGRGEREAASLVERAIEIANEPTDPPQLITDSI